MLGEEFSTVYDDIKNNKISAIRDYENRIKAVANNDRYKVQIENATEWLRDEFNPLITESMAPVITEFHVNTIYEGYVAPLVPNAKAHVVAEIRDVAGISRVRIRSLCPDVIYMLMIWTQEFQFSGDETTVYIDTVTDVTEYSAVLTYNISVNATDTLGNCAEWYKEVDGPVGAFIKTVTNMLRAFWDFLCEVGAKILEAVNFIVEWIKEIIRSAIYSLLGPVWNAKGQWNDEISDVLTHLGEAYGVIGSKQNSNSDKLAVLMIFLLSVIGPVVALVSPSPIDEFEPAIGYIDETIDAICVGITLAGLI